MKKSRHFWFLCSQKSSADSYRIAGCRQYCHACQSKLRTGMDSTDAPLSDGPVTSTVEISNNVMEWREQVREQVTDSTTRQIRLPLNIPTLKSEGTPSWETTRVQTILKHPKKSAESHLDGKRQPALKLIRKILLVRNTQMQCIVFETEDNPISPTT